MCRASPLPTLKTGEPAWGDGGPGGAYTRQETDAAIDNKVVEIGAGDMARAVYAANGEPGVVDAAVHARAADDGVKLYTHTRSGTVHEFTGSGASGRALMTADVQEGDTFSVNGQPVTAWMGAEDAATMMAGQPYTGRWVTFVTEDDTLNFKGGVGLPLRIKSGSSPKISATGCRSARCWEHWGPI